SDLGLHALDHAAGVSDRVPPSRAQPGYPVARKGNGAPATRVAPTAGGWGSPLAPTNEAQFDGLRPRTRMTHAVELECAAKTYGVKRQVVALDNVTAAFPYGTSTAILGPSGSGKSTLLLLAAGLLPPDRGRVTLLGRD